MIVVDAQADVADDLSHKWPNDVMGAVVGYHDRPSISVPEGVVTSAAANVLKSSHFRYTT